MSVEQAREFSSIRLKSKAYEVPSAWGRVIAILAASTMLIQAGCAGLPGMGPAMVPAAQRIAYDAAVGRLPADSQGAATALQVFLMTYPESQLADDAAEQLANLSFAVGRQEEGMRWLEKILSRYSSSDRALAARLQLARLKYAQDDRVAARALVSDIDLRRFDLSDQRVALRLKVALAQSPVERLEMLSQLRSVLVDEIDRQAEGSAVKDRLTGRLNSVEWESDQLISRAASGELEEMMWGLRGGGPAPQIALELCRRALDAGQLDLAASRIARTESLAVNDADRAALTELRMRLAQRLEMAEANAELPPLRELVGRPRPRTEDARGTIGVVLPLSGDFADYGEQSLHGILLAADLFAELGESGPSKAGEDEGLERARRSDIRVLVRDSEGDPAKAASAVRDLAMDPDLMAIVGPIFSSESLAAAEAAEQVGVPLIALSTREDVPTDRSQVFRTRTTPADEVGALVGHAFEELGAQRFAVLYPKTRYGRGMRKLYWDAVTAGGGKMVAASSYDPDAVDFSTAIKNMIGHRFLTHWERKALKQRKELLRDARRIDKQQAALLRREAYGILGPELMPLPPIVDFDVLFIPDAADKIALIGPGLAFHEVRGVKLLGSSDWVDEKLPRVGRNHVAGAIVSTPFYPESDVPFVTEFVEAYRNTFGEEPDAYAAEAYDATNLLLVQLSAGRSDREGIRAGLLDTRAYPGAAGVLTMQPNGNARRRPFLLKISGQRFQPVD